MFLKTHTQTVPTILQDYPEWHRGRQLYGLWYIDITDPEIIAYLHSIQQCFADVLLEENQRQFHITVFVCGFIDSLTSGSYNDDFSSSQLKAQLNQLNSYTQPAFQLKTAALNSFETALFVEVEDLGQCLPHLRRQLGLNCSEIAALQYCPHITLGLYRKAVPAEQIFNRIAKINIKTFRFDISFLTFGSYQAQILQGPLEPHTIFQLGDACCNSF